MLVVFGGTGFLGQGLAARLSAGGLPWRAAPPSAACDLADVGTVARFLDGCGPEPLRIINLAVVGKFTANTPDGLRRNVAMTAGLIEALRGRTVAALVQASSLDVYGERPPVPLTEESPTAPVDFYGLAKRVTEQMLALEPALARVLTVARLPGLYAPDATDDGVVSRFWRLVRDGRTVTVHGDGSARRDFVCRDDAADILCALARRQTGAGLLNVGTGESLSIREVLDRMGRACGTPPHSSFVPAGGRDFDIVLDTAKLRSVLPDVTATPLSTWINALPGRTPAPDPDVARPA